MRLPRASRILAVRVTLPDVAVPEMGDAADCKTFRNSRRPGAIMAAGERFRIRRTGSHELVLTGGTALNGVATMRLMEHFDGAFYERCLEVECHIGAIFVQRNADAPEALTQKDRVGFSPGWCRPNGWASSTASRRNTRSPSAPRSRN